MYEIQRRKGRLLTASSLALAVILTAGAGTGWAADNVTTVDQTTGVVSGPGGAGQTLFLSKIQDPTGTATTITGKLADPLVTASRLTTDSTTATAIKVETNTTGVFRTLELVGEGGNLVQNDSGTLLDLEIGNTTVVGVTGKGGNFANIKGQGIANSIFYVDGGVTGGTTVNTASISDLYVDVDGASTLNVTGNVTDSRALVDNNSIFNVTGNVADSDVWVANNSIFTITGKLTNSNLVAGLHTVTELLGTEPNDWAQERYLRTLGLTFNSDGTISDWNTAWLDRGLDPNKYFVPHTAISSILTIATPTTIDNGNSYHVGTPVGTAATFGDGSLLVVDAAGVRNNPTNNAALTNTNPGGSAAINDNASLYTVNTQFGDTVILRGFDGGIIATREVLSPNELAEGWGKNLRFDTRLFDASQATVAVDDVSGTVTLDTTDAYVRAGNAYADGRISGGTAAMIDGLYTTTNSNLRNDVDSDNAGIKFVSRAVNENYLDATSTGRQNNGTKVVTTLEGAASMAATAGVQSSTYSIANTLAGNYNARLSYLNDVAPSGGSGEPGTIGIWVNPFYNSTNVDGVRIGRHNGEYDFDYGGGTIGLDSNINEMFRLGLAFSAGGGSTDSKGSNFNKTDSDFDFWGLGIYGSYTNGMFGLTGDISYSGVSYDIDQRLPSSMGMNKLTADVDTDTFTVGLTGEYRFITESNLNIIPHLGLRYLNMQTDSYRVKEKGRGNVFSIGSETQNIWTIPLGVTFTGDINTSNNWVIQPKADLGVIFATGDLDADSRFRINGTGFGGRLTADDVVDNVTFNGLIGLKAENCDGFSLGLDYNFKASDNLTSHGVTGTIRYDF